MTLSTPDLVISMVCRRASRWYNMTITPETLRAVDRTQPMASVRQLAMWVLRRTSDQALPLKWIGRQLGRSDHTTVMCALKAIDKRRAEDKVFCRRTDEMLQEIQRFLRMRGTLANPDIASELAQAEA